jgi:hypothetical protein
MAFVALYLPALTRPVIVGLVSRRTTVTTGVSPTAVPAASLGLGSTRPLRSRHDGRRSTPSPPVVLYLGYRGGMCGVRYADQIIDDLLTIGGVQRKLWDAKVE